MEHEPAVINPTDTSAISPGTLRAHLPSKTQFTILLVLALILLVSQTFPSWSPLSTLLSAFPLYWRVPTNHLFIVLLFLKAGSPLLVGGFGFVGLCLYNQFRALGHYSLEDTQAWSEDPHAPEREEASKTWFDTGEYPDPMARTPALGQQRAEVPEGHRGVSHPPISPLISATAPELPALDILPGQVPLQGPHPIRQDEPPLPPQPSGGTPTDTRAIDLQELPPVFQALLGKSPAERPPAPQVHEREGRPPLYQDPPPHPLSTFTPPQAAPSRAHIPAPHPARHPGNGSPGQRTPREKSAGVRPLSPRGEALLQRRQARFYGTAAAPPPGNEHPEEPRPTSTPTREAPGATQTETQRDAGSPAPMGLEPPSTPVSETSNEGSTALAATEATPGTSSDDALPRIEISVLQRLQITLYTQEGKPYAVPIPENAMRRVHLLAYLAYRRRPIARDKMLEDVFGHGRSDEEATKDKLVEMFDSHKKLLRQDIRRTIETINTEAGRELVSPQLDLFSHRHRLYSLTAVCQVVDLEAVEMWHAKIEQARKEGLLVDRVPEDVKLACDALLAAYPGDFLDTYLTLYREDFEPWSSSWVREPFTLYRDCFLQALWYSAEYEAYGGLVLNDQAQVFDAKGEQARKKQREHYSKAAELYERYAMHACRSRFDTKVTFGAGNRQQYGERVVMSEAAIRLAISLYGAIGSVHLVDQAFAAYSRQMRSVSAKAWEASPKTLAALQAAKSRTGALHLQVLRDQQADLTTHTPGRASHHPADNKQSDA